MNPKAGFVAMTNNSKEVLDLMNMANNLNVAVSWFMGFKSFYRSNRNKWRK